MSQPQLLKRLTTTFFSSLTLGGLAIALAAPHTLRAQDDLRIQRDNFHKSPPKIIVESLILDSQDWAGHVSGAYASSSLLTNRDTIYLSLKNPSVSVGDAFAIFTDIGPVSIPGEFDREIGKEVRLKGFCEVTKVVGNSIVAQIYDASMDISKGDKIAPLSEVSVALAPKQPRKMIRGKIIKGASDGALIGPFELVYLNRGGRDGLEVNDRLFVYRTDEISETINKDLPQVNSAELVVVNVSERVATAYVLSAEDSFRQGASFKTAISDIVFLEDQQLDESSDAAKQQDLDEATFQGPRSLNYGTLGLGMATPADRNGLHSPNFSTQLEVGGRYWSLPFQYGLRSESIADGASGVVRVYSHDLTLAPQAHLMMPLIKSMPRLWFVGGFGPSVSMRISSARETGASIKNIYAYRFGIQMRAEARYFLNDQFYISLIPVTGDIFFYHYVKALGAGRGEADTTGQMSSYLGFGMSF